MKHLDIRRLAPSASAGVVAEGLDASYGTRAPALKASPAGLPDYLERHYAWAYVWPFSVWFFDHQPIINAILFGNYRRIMRATMRFMDLANAGKTLQVAGVYGELSPTLALGLREPLHLIDAAPIQLEAARRKVEAIGKTIRLGRMHAEALQYAGGTFDTVLLFLLLHEMPPQARRAALREAVRVLKPGGSLVIAEYGENKGRHFFHRLAPMRAILTWAEPFLGGFWSENLSHALAECGAMAGRNVTLDAQVDVFGGFYRVARYRAS
jgi:ubiquinone/menaquinone biosynthesis C-methylase UbiE